MFGDSQDRKKQRYQEAIRLYKTGQYEHACGLFSDNIGGDDLCSQLSRFYAADCHTRLGLGALRKRRFAEAVRHFTEASKLNPQSHQLSHYLANCLVQMRDFGRAVTHYDRARSLASNQAAPQIRMALCLWRDGQPEAAISTLHEAATKFPDVAELQFQLGLLEASREAYDVAMAAMTRALELDPGHIDAMVNLAMCYGATGQPKQAIELLLGAQRRRPHDAHIGLYLAFAHEAVESPAGTSLRFAVPLASPVFDVGDIEELTSLIVKEPDVVDAFIALPPEHLEADVFQLLSGVLDRAVLQQPGNATLYYHQARIYDRLGRRELAIASCERAVEIDPQLVQALITLAKLYRSTDRRQDAASRLQQVIDMGYEYADVYYLMGCIYRDQGDRLQARELLSKALEINVQYQAAREALESLAA